MTELIHFDSASILTLVSLFTGSLFLYLNLSTPQAVVSAGQSQQKRPKRKLKIDSQPVADYADLPLCKTFFILHVTDRTKPLVVFLHGFTASTQSYKPIMEKIKGSEMNYLAFDFIAHGKSGMLPEGKEMTNDLLATHLNQLLDYLFPDAAHSLELIIVGHSQAGTFAPRYALQEHSSTRRVKSVILITPGGIDFKFRDYLDNPIYFIFRNLYLGGCNKTTQSAVIHTSAFLVSQYNKYCWKPLSKPIFHKLLPMVLPDPYLKQVSQEYYHLLHDWLSNFENFTSTAERRKNFIRMIMSMMDNLDLLRDNTSVFEALAKTGIPVELILARYDPVVTIQAGNRLFYRMNPSKEAIQMKSMVYGSSDHLMTPTFDENACSEDDEIMSDDSSLYSCSPNVNVHILKATHLVPVEAPHNLSQIVFDSYTRVCNAQLKD